MPQIAIALAVSAITTALSFAFQALFSKTPEGPRTEEFRATTSRYGAPIPITYGSIRVGSNLIDAGSVREVRRTTGSKRNKRTIFEYFQTIALGICEGQINRIVRIWADKEVIYDARSVGSTGSTPVSIFTLFNLLFGTNVDPNNASAKATAYATVLNAAFTGGVTKKFPFTLVEYQGSETQTADPTLAALHGIANTPAYRGLAYVVLPDFPLHQTNNRIPITEFEVVGFGPTGFSWLVSEPLAILSGLPETDFDLSGTPTPGASSTNYYNMVLHMWQDPARPYIYARALAAYSDPTLSNDVTYPSAFVKISKLTGETILLEPSRYIAGSSQIYPEYDITPAALIAPPYRDRLFTVKTFDGFFGYNPAEETFFVEIDPNTLYPIANSTICPDITGAAGYTPINTPASKITQICCDGNGDQVFAIFDGFASGNGGGDAYGYWDTKTNTVSWGYFNQINPEYNNEPSGNHFKKQPGWSAACFDQAGTLWLGTRDWYLDRYQVSSNGTFTLLGRYTFLSSQPAIPAGGGVTWAFGVNAITYVPASNELLIWYLDENAFGKLVRFSINSLVASSSVFPVQFVNQSILFETMQLNQGDPQGQSPQNDKAGVWTDDPMFTSINQSTSPITTFYLINAETGVQTPYSLDLWYQGGGPPSEFQNNLFFNSTMNAFFAARFDDLQSQDYIANPLQQGFGIYFLDKVQPGGTTLRAICEDLTLKVGGSLALTDYTLLTDPVRGYIVDRRMTARAAIQTLQPAFLFQIVESDWVLKGTHYGSAPVLTITEELLGAKQELTETKDKLLIKRINERELPEWIDFNFFDATRDYLLSNEHARRSEGTQSSDNRAQVDVPVVLTPDEGATASLKLLYFMWSKQEELEFTTWFNALSADPGDSILVNRGTRQFELRVKRWVLGANGILSIEAESIDSGVFSLTAKSTSISGFVPGFIADFSPPKLFILDTALLRVSDDVPGLYATAGPEIFGLLWGGASIEKSSDNINFLFEVAINSGLTYGFSQNALANYDFWTTWDTINTLTITLKSGTALSSVTQAQLLADVGLNLALVGDELIQFATATQITGSQWQLSTLLRGRFGTEQHRLTHVVGDRFIMINQSVINTIEYSSSEIDQIRYYRAVGSGSNPLSPSQSIVQLTRRLWPLAPYYIQATRPGSAVITWLRRSRIPGSFLASSPLFEASEDYEVDILLNSGSLVLRTITTTASAGGSFIDAPNRTCHYTVADQITDFGTPPSVGNLRVIVYQKSAVVGRGYGGEAFV